MTPIKQALDALKEIEQAFREVKQAIVNPQWFSGGGSAAKAHGVRWINKGFETTREAIAALEAMQALTDEHLYASWRVWASSKYPFTNVNKIHLARAPLAAQPEPPLSVARIAHIGEGESPVISLVWHVATKDLEARGVTVDALLYVQEPQPSQAPVAQPLQAQPVNGFGCVKPDTDKQVFFYEQDFYVLSNFSAFNLVWRTRVFPTSEHAYHWEKFGKYDNGGGVEMSPMYELRDDIRTAPSAHEAFKLAERNKTLRRPDWDSIKVGVMRDILREKVRQHEYVRRKLLATGDRELIEDSWRDDFWGWGPNRDGQNMLGKLWMDVRAELRAAITKTRGDHE